MNRLPSEQNLPDNVTNKDIEKYFGYSANIVTCDCCNRCFDFDEMIEWQDDDGNSELHCKKCQREQF